MEFYLKYDGPLKSNGSAQDKHNIREYLYPQMKKLWDIKPLNHLKEPFLTPGKVLSVLKDIDGVVFAPLVSNVLKFVCQLEVTLLWPDELGVISGHGGDIDNRLKTLFDALQCPDSNQVQPVKDRILNKQPFFCLLENDKLVTSINIKTHTLLRSENKIDVSVLIRVIVKSTEVMIKTIGLSG